MVMLFGDTTISYRPKVAKALGSVTAAVLLEKMVHKAGMMEIFDLVPRYEVGFSETEYKEALEKINDYVLTEGNIGKLNVPAIEKLVKETYNDSVDTYFTSECEVKKISPKKETKPKKDDRIKQKNAFVMNGSKMSQDFDIDKLKINLALQLGYHPQDVLDETVKFLTYYKNGKGRTISHRDWNHKFVYEWLDNGYKKGYLKRNGQFYTTSANTERREAIGKLIDPNLFGDIED